MEWENREFEEVDVLDKLDFQGKWSMVGQVPWTQGSTETSLGKSSLSKTKVQAETSMEVRGTLVQQNGMGEQGFQRGRGGREF